MKRMPRNKRGRYSREKSVRTTNLLKIHGDTATVQNRRERLSVVVKGPVVQEILQQHDSNHSDNVRHENVTVRGNESIQQLKVGSRFTVIQLKEKFLYKKTLRCWARRYGVNLVPMDKEKHFNWFYTNDVVSREAESALRGSGWCLEIGTRMRSQASTGSGQCEKKPRTKKSAMNPRYTENDRI
jgi:hypothetical protein